MQTSEKPRMWLGIRRAAVYAAYGAYSLVALTLVAGCATFMAAAAREDLAGAQVILMVLLLPLVMASLAAAAAGLLLSLVLWREWPLLLNAASVVGLLSVVWLGESNGMTDAQAFVAVLAAATVLMLTCVWWFARGRRLTFEPEAAAALTIIGQRITAPFVIVGDALLANRRRAAPRKP